MADHHHIEGAGGLALCGARPPFEPLILAWDGATGAPVLRPPCGDCCAINQGAHARGVSAQNAPPQPPGPPPAPFPAALPPQPTVNRGGVHIIADDGASLCGYSDGMADVPCGDCAAINQGAQAAGRPASRSAAVSAALGISPAAAHPTWVLAGSNGPASNITMHGPQGQPLAPKGVVSGGPPYVWGFDWGKPPQPGERFMFRSDEREITVEIGPDGRSRTIEERSLPGLAAISPMARISGAGPARPKVSVFTCSYNRPDLLRRACESLRAQSDPDWEHLICDDASSDPRVADTLKWAAEDRRCRIWRRSANADRPALLWNHMLDRAMGRYFTALDDDNEKLPEFVSRMAGHLDGRPGIDIVTCGWIVVHEGHGAGEYHLNLSTSPGNLSNGSTCDGGSMLYRREIFERAGYFPESLRTNEDWAWLRRAARGDNVLNIHECLATYRVHDAQRMARCENLGNRSDEAWVKRMSIHDPYGCRIVRPPQARLTRSQEDAIGSADRALRAIPWVCPGDDLAIVMSPFQMTDADIAGGLGSAPVVVSVHIEDPYALAANMERVRGLIASGREIWVSTNDASAVPYYRSLVGDRVICCPLLGVDGVPAAGSAPRDIDVLLCGYAYPSRRRFVDDLLPRLGGLRVVLCGDGWEDRACEHMGTQDLGPTYALYARSKTIIVAHRVHGDCSDGPVEPATVNRCYTEGVFGARVFVDQSRGGHSMEPGDVEWYSDPADLADKLRAALAGGADPAADPRAAAFAARCGLLYSYRARMARIINCVRGPRYLAEIP